ncbi:uncharacterized protein LOC110036283 [Phalaenopsis equestris]|uniref:uncharacterized protein LOC110036283 n=1 Tax=Phalaenopsis equestris TaxID=78828 RepID=UPI0009E2253C|nr:uncharacterized protein LOC110036283 [Phalaenopsis equestris]
MNKHCRGGNLILKFDIRKAYDTINWDFIEEVLYAKGFNEQFILLIHRWLRNNSQSVFINGKSHGFLTSSRGIKQGDPLSPTIFIITFDFFSKMLNQLMVSSPHTLYSHRSNIAVNHLAFTYDVIIFAKATKPAVKLVLQCLEKLQQCSGQRKQMHWTSWQKLCGSTRADGLGFKSLIQMSQINFCKLWLMFKAQSSLWANLLKGKYCEEVHPSLVNKRLGDSRAWTNMLKVRSQVENLFIWKIGEGKLNIWLDNWTGEGLINTSSNPQFNPATQVAEIWFNGDWNQQALQNILDNKTLQKVMKSSIDRESKDILIVKKKVSQSLSAAIANFCFPQHRDSWSKCVWNKFLSPSMSFFSWRLLHGFLPTDDILKLKGLRGPSRCGLCKSQEETIKHLFF